MRMPRFVENLYRDMRDRRLLLPALALVVALIAVPVALSRSSSSAPPPPQASVTGGDEEAATEPAVLSEQLGVTNYRKRLNQLESKNPFREQFVGLPPGAKLQTTTGGTGSTATGTTSTSGVSSSSLSGTSASGGSTTSVSATSTEPSGSGASPGSVSPKPRSRRYFAFRVSVEIGPAGDLTERDGVKRLTFLPGKNRPLVAFVGVTEDTEHAIFVISDDVSSVRGDGRCTPRRGSCNFLELKPGDKASLEYAPEGDRTYNLKLHDIKLVPVPKPHGNASHKRAPQPVLGPDG
jgi:hypothetical protein